MMTLIVKLWGIIMVVFGVLAIIKQDVMKKYIAFWAKENRLYAGGVMAIIIGAIFLFAAAKCKLAWFVILMGIIAIMKGLSIVVLGPKKWLSYLDVWMKKPKTVMQALAILEIALGLLLIYSV